MATIVRGSIPATQLALNGALERLPGLEIECERIVQSPDSAVLPLLWMRHGDREAVDAALAADPTVEGENCLTAFDDEYLYRMEWVDQVHLLLHMLTNGAATILDAYGRNDRWRVRVLYPDREHLSHTHEFADRHGLTFDIDAIREMEDDPAGRFDLTDGQYDALVLATERGYYDVPRGATLEELADDLGVSHQSLSERLRRGTEALVEDTLRVGRAPR